MDASRIAPTLVRSSREPVDGAWFDVVVVGGGINGVAIARECARAGKRTLLTEQHDFASGTTSRSTRIIHGGLRYLEHGEFALVRESLADRERLLRERPHLVRPMNFLLALRPGALRNAFTVRTGLWVYRRLGNRRAPADRLRVADARRRFEQMLDADRRWAVFSYEDAQCEFPERLVAEWVAEAAAAGAVIRNHTRAVKIERSGGRVRGLVLQDCISGVEERVQAETVVNATGPWADQLCLHSGIVPGEPMVGGVRGSHLVLPRFEGAPQSAVYVEAVDGRPMFVVPWNKQLLVGTTEVRDSGDPARTQPSDDEINYLLKSVNAIFRFARMTRSDIVYAFAGVRPLPFAPGASPSAVTRRHVIHNHAAEGATGLVSIIGGKLTTAASLARETARALGIDVPEPAIASFDDSDADLDAAMAHWAREISHAGRLTKSTARVLGEWYGPRAARVARFARTSDVLREPLCPHTPHVVAEAVFAMTDEFAVTLADVLLRRVPVALGPCWSRECTRMAARRLGRALAWSAARVELEMQQCEEERLRFLVKPAARPLEAALPVPA